MKHILFIACMLNILNGWGQTYTVKRLGLEKGLSNNYVIDITEDKNGYLWFATEEGLNKLEGTRFTSYYKTEEGEQGMTGNELNCLLDDPKDPILWIGTQRAGLNAFNYDRHTFTIYRHNENDPQSLATDDVTGVYPAQDGNLWITTYWKGVDYFDKKTGTFTHYNKETIPQFPGQHVWTALEDGKGNLYIGHKHEGLTILSLKTKKIENFRHNDNQPTSIPGDEVLCLYQDQTGAIWVGTDKGLAVYNPEQKIFFRYNTPNSPLSNAIYDICQLNDKQLWIATEFGGIAILDLSQRLFSSSGPIKFHYIQEGDNEYSLSNSSVRTIFQDSYNNIWVGLWGGGINFLNNDATLFNTFHYSKDMPGSNLSARIASAVCTDLEGRLWVGTDGGGINVLENGMRTATYTSEKGTLSGNSVQTAYCDSQGDLWFGFFRQGMMHYDSKERQFKQVFPANLKNEDVRSIFEDREGTLWIGSSNGIYLINRESKEIINHIDVPENLVRGIITDTQGRIWVGTFGGGLFLYSDKMELDSTFNTFAGFPSNTINNLYEDRQQRIWVATGDGLVCFPSAQSLAYKVYQRTDGLNNTHINAITEDHAGNIWFSTNKGITCLKAADSKFYNYDSKDNIPLASFNHGSVCQDQKGNLYFGSTDGICYFYPETVLATRHSPKADITSITFLAPLLPQANKEQVCQLSDKHSIRLKHHQNSFSVSFCIPNYALADQVEYAYMVKGLGDSWYSPADHNYVIFRDIPPGEYELMVRTRIRNQAWSDEISAFSITITPPFWLSWIAKSVYVLIGLALLYFSLRAYKRKINLEYLYESEKWNHEQEQQLNNERLRFFTNITHELRTPLTLIIGPLEDMLVSRTLTGKDKHRISVIHQSALRLLNLVNQILEFRKTETQNKKLCVCQENVVPVVYEVGLKYKELNQNPLINIQIQTETEEMILHFDKEALTIILDNLISNALKYTAKGIIAIRARWIEEDGGRYLELSVQDTGFGISPESLPHIFNRYYQEGSSHQASGTGIGLALVKNLVNLHEGQIEVESQLNAGTTFRIKLLAGNTYPLALHRDYIDEKEKGSEAESSPKDAAQDATQTRPVILVVEDNQDILDYITDSFTDLYEVKTAKNGKEGVEIALESIPDMIVSDVMMPVMDGNDLCKKLKKDIRTSHIPIILLTAKDTLADKEEGYQSGADSYLTKPFSASLLHSRINNLLAQRRRLIERYSAKPDPKDAGKVLEEKRSLLTESLNKLDQEFLEKMRQAITDNLSATETIDISFLASHLCMSNSTLYRKVKALTGMSTNEYIRKVKMQLAEKMLLEGKYSISEIAFKVGINSSVYFRQCFKEEFGLSPSDYLKRIKENPA